MQYHRIFFPVLLCAVTTLAPAPSRAAAPGPPANVVMVAGNGQVTQTNFATTVPLTVRVTDANGIPVSGVPVSWAITQVSDNGSDPGTLNHPTGQTDSNGLSTTNFISSLISPGLSYVSYVVTATTSAGSVTFFETAVPFQTASGSLAQLPFVQLFAPPPENLVVTGTAGSTLPAGVVAAVVAQSGLSLGQGIANVGLRIVSFTGDPNVPPPPPPAVCNGQAGIALSGANGFVSCDLVLGNTPGTYTVNALVGEFQFTRNFNITITQGQICTFSISPQSQSFGSNAATGSVNVTATSGCAWTAISNASSFLTITSGASGNGNGTVFYSVAANSGGGRSGTLSIAGQTFTATQSAVGSGNGPLTITSGQNPPGGIVNSSYSATLTATGGQQPYTWQVSQATLPPGLSLGASSGTISGAPTTAGIYTFTVTVSDSTNAQQSQMFTINVSAAGTGGLTITNPGFPAGIVNVPYNPQLLTSTSAPCGSPFSPPPVFALQSGTLPPGLSVQSNGGGYSIAGTPTAPGTFSFTLGVTNTCGQSASASFSITINGVGTTTVLNANPAGLTFNVAPSGAAQTQQVTVTSTGTAVSFTAAASTSSGGNWLSVTTNGPTTPAVLNVTVSNFQALATGTYQGSITISASGNNTLTVPVTLIVAGTTAAGLSVTPSFLPFNLSTNSSSQQIVSVQSNVVGTPFTASAQTFTGGNWLNVQSSSATTPATLTVTVNTNGLPSGSYNGAINLSSSSAGTQTVQVTLFVTTPSFFVDPKALAFNATGGGSSPDPQAINLFFSGAPFNVTASTTTLAGGSWLFVTQPSAAPTAVTVSVNISGLARGTYNGTVIFTSADTTVAPIRVAVTLTIGTGPGPIVNGVVNAASALPGPVAPGEIVTIFGVNPGPASPFSLVLTSPNTVATSLGGIRVLFDGIPAPLTYASTTQINAIVPYEIFGRVRTQLQVEFNGVLSIPVDLGVTLSAPGIFTLLTPIPTGAGNQAAALNQDGSINGQGNGAAPGSIVTLFATGEGQTSPPGITGAILSQPLLPVSVRIGGLPATILYAGTAPSLVAGVMQVNVRIPATVARGVQVQVLLTVGDNTSNQVSITITP